MAIYVTTSRKPSMPTRRLAKWLVALLGGEGENRGKRSLQEALERAEAKGFDRVLVINEDHGNPGKLSFVQGGGWKESILLKSIELPAAERERRRFPRAVVGKAVDAAGEKILALLGVGANEGEGPDGRGVDFVEVSAGAREISFSVGGKRAGPVLKILGLVE